MLTSLVTVAVVTLAILGATAITVKDPDQPATLRARRRRERARRRRASASVKSAQRPGQRKGRQRRGTPVPAPRPVAAPVPAPTWPGPLPAPADGTGLADHWVPTPVGTSVWIRIRSGVVLTVLLAIVGALIALSVAGVIVFIALALRSAVS